VTPRDTLKQSLIAFIAVDDEDDDAVAGALTDVICAIAGVLREPVNTVISTGSVIGTGAGAANSGLPG
jgi:hypothetical protein